MQEREKKRREKERQTECDEKYNTEKEYGSVSCLFNTDNQVTNRAERET